MDSIDETLEIPTPPPLELLRPLIPDMRWTSSRLAAQLLGNTQAFYADWTVLQGETPYAVYHYTDAEGLNAILESGRIWASDLLYVAGSRETDFVRDLISTQLRQRANVSDPVLREFCERAETLLDPRTWQRSVFATCFCQNGDALGQWRAYGGPRGGYAIGLRTQALTETAGRYPSIALRRVIYDPDRQTAILSSLLDRAMFALRSPDAQSEEDAVDTVLEFVADHVVELVACFKHAAFGEDHEWRLLVVADTAYPGEGLAQVRFRHAGGHIVPYMEIDVSPNRGPAASPIAEVICGPLERADLSTRAIELLLKKRALSAARVRASALALR
jgi:hypothetical protein